MSEPSAEPLREVGGGAVQPACCDGCDIGNRLSVEAARMQEEERRKLSLELHDDIAQLLGNLILMMDACLALGPEDGQRLQRYLSSARETAKEGFRRVQRFSIDLRPPMLDDLGLAPTIAWYAERFSQDTEIPVDVVIPERLPSLNGEQETALFRIAQEALQNVRKHARAGRVSISLRQEAGRLRLMLQDDGVGFDPVTVAAKLAQGTHLGLAGMRHRAAMLGGSLEFSSGAGRGTRITASIPVKPIRLATGMVEDPTSVGTGD